MNKFLYNQIISDISKIVKKKLNEELFNKEDSNDLLNNDKSVLDSYIYNEYTVDNLFQVNHELIFKDFEPGTLIFENYDIASDQSKFIITDELCNNYGKFDQIVNKHKKNGFYLCLLYCGDNLTIYTCWAGLYMGYSWCKDKNTSFNKNILKTTDDDGYKNCGYMVSRYKADFNDNNILSVIHDEPFPYILSIPSIKQLQKIMVFLINAGLLYNLFSSPDIVTSSTQDPKNPSNMLTIDNNGDVKSYGKTERTASIACYLLDKKLWKK